MQANKQLMQHKYINIWTWYSTYTTSKQGEKHSYYRNRSFIHGMIFSRISRKF